MKALLASPAAKYAATLIGSVFLASPSIPPLAPFSAFLMPLGSFLLGAYHVTIPARAP